MVGLFAARLVFRSRHEITKKKITAAVVDWASLPVAPQSWSKSRASPRPAFGATGGGHALYPCR